MKETKNAKSRFQKENHLVIVLVTKEATENKDNKEVRMMIMKEARKMCRKLKHLTGAKISYEIHL